jgi:hypothetical protein
MPKVVIVGDMTFGESGPPTPPPIGGRPPRPGQGLPPTRPGRPIDPDWGIDEGEAGGDGEAVWPIPPGGGSLPVPPIAGQPLPPIDPPPGTIWPPLPPSIPPGKTLVYAGIAGVGHRYIVVDIPPPRPGHGLPPTRPGRPEGPEIDPPDYPDREPKRR